MRALCPVAAATLSVIASLAPAAEGLGLRVDAGVDIGVVEKATASFDDRSYDMANYRGVSLVPRVTVTRQFGEMWSASLRIRGVIGFDDDGADVMKDEDGDTSVSAFDIGAAAGCTFKVGGRFEVTPLLGLSWRTYGVEGDGDPYDVEFDADMLTVDLGAEARVGIGERLSLTGSVLLGIPFTGSNDLKQTATGFSTSDDADFGGGLLYAIGGGIEYRLVDRIALTAGLAYEATRVDWEWDDADTDGDDDLSRFSIQLGASFKF